SCHFRNRRTRNSKPARVRLPANRNRGSNPLCDARRYSAFSMHVLPASVGPRIATRCAYRPPLTVRASFSPSSVPEGNRRAAVLTGAVGLMGAELAITVAFAHCSGDGCDSRHFPVVATVQSCLVQL